MSQQHTMSAPGTILDLGGGVSVREYRTSDAVANAKHANNQKIRRKLRDRFPHPYTEEESVHWIKLCLSDADRIRSGAWTLENGSSGPLTCTKYVIAINDEACGSIGLDFGSDVYFRSAELGYWLGEDHWGQGIMSRVVPAFVDWTWKTFGILVRLNGEAVESNAASVALLQKGGLKIEGRREKFCCKDGVLQDALMFGAVRA